VRPQEVDVPEDPRGHTGTCLAVVAEEALDIHPEPVHRTVVGHIHAAPDPVNTDRVILGKEDNFLAAALGTLQTLQRFITQSGISITTEMKASCIELNSGSTQPAKGKLIAFKCRKALAWELQNNIQT
jgi:hypothetical protein